MLSVHASTRTFRAWYADGDLFLGHSITVEGSLVDEEMYVAYMS
ncbi:MAG: DUF2262 domain-containing protein [Rikenella sp.]|nr:DUF2262 domain-containing protein [Rikenella sp.]